MIWYSRFNCPLIFSGLRQALRCTGLVWLKDGVQPTSGNGSFETKENLAASSGHKVSFQHNKVLTEATEHTTCLVESMYIHLSCFDRHAIANCIHLNTYLYTCI